MVYFQTKKQFGSILEGLGMEKVGMFYCNMEYIMAIWYILWPFGNLTAIWYISRHLCQEISGNPASSPLSETNGMI
jgi:hypothetical protein